MDPVLARMLGLRAVRHDYRERGGPRSNKGGVLWMVEDARTGKELGSWVPLTGSARILNRVVVCPSAEYALRLFGEAVREMGGRVL